MARRGKDYRPARVGDLVEIKSGQRKEGLGIIVQRPEGLALRILDDELKMTDELIGIVARRGNDRSLIAFENLTVVPWPSEILDRADPIIAGKMREEAKGRRPEPFRQGNIREYHITQDGKIDVR